MWTVARFVVVKGRINSPPIISKNILVKLRMLQIRGDGSFVQNNNIRIADPVSGIKQSRAIKTTVYDSRNYRSV